MAQYIDKAAVVTEIEELISNGKIKCQQSQENNDQVSYIAWSEHIAACGKILSFLDALEVKEIDLKKEYDNKFFKDPVFCKLVNRNAGISIAKYFFELGLNAKKEETKQLKAEEEITDNTRACCNCISGATRYPNCYCWQHKDCNTDEPYKIPEEDWVETAKTCKDFELELNRI